MASTRSALLSLKRLFTTTMAHATTFTPSAAKVAMQQGTDSPKYVTIAQIQGRVLDTEVVPISGVADLSAVSGNTVPIDTVGAITDFTLDEGASCWVEVTADGVALSSSGTIQDIPGKEKVCAAGDKFEVVGLAGGASQIRQYVSKSGTQARPLTFHCRVVSTANVNIATGLNNGDVLNGTTLATNDVVLLPFQSTGSQNGVYVVGVTPARHELFDTYDSLLGTLFVIDEGPTYGNAPSVWTSSSSPGGTVDVDDIDFELLIGSLGRQPSNNVQAENAHFAGAVTFIWYGLWLQAAASAFWLVINVAGVLTGVRELVIDVNDANRRLDMSGDLTVLSDGTVEGNLKDTSPIVAVTDVDSPYAVDAADTRTVYTNAGTANDVVFVLPDSGDCVAGKTRSSFYNLSGGSYKNSIQVNGTDHLLFRGSTALDITGGGLASDNRDSGDFVTVLYIGGGIWITEANSQNWS